MTRFSIIAVSALLGAFLAAAANADTGDVTVVQGCDVVEMPGGYGNKVDPTCAFDVLSTGGSSPVPTSIPTSGFGS